jgi:hypothetical protein
MLDTKPVIKTRQKLTAKTMITGAKIIRKTSQIPSLMIGILAQIFFVDHSSPKAILRASIGESAINIQIYHTLIISATAITIKGSSIAIPNTTLIPISKNITKVSVLLDHVLNDTKLSTDLYSVISTPT